MLWTPTLLRCGSFRLDAGCMFGLIPRVVWSKWFGAGVIDDANRMPLETNALLLSAGGRLVVIEAGIGDKMSPKEQAMYAQQMNPASSPGVGRARTIVDALHEVGAAPGDVSAVLVTHLHFDHAGGVTRLGASGDPEKPELTFANATIVTQRQEWDDAIANKSTMNKTYLRNHLNDEVRQRTTMLEGETAVPGVEGLRVIPVPGHTWGQQVVAAECSVRGERRTVVFCNDVMPTALHARPTTNLSYDVEPYTSMLERTKLLERAERERWILVLDHEPGDPVFTVRRDAEKGLVLEPASLA
jgi:glyoxylase-like metal-dependent hydrolase (beta-lactamase superfamily II)